MARRATNHWYSSFNSCFPLNASYIHTHYRSTPIKHLIHCKYLFILSALTDTLSILYFRYKLEAK